MLQANIALRWLSCHSRSGRGISVLSVVILIYLWRLWLPACQSIVGGLSSCHVCRPGSVPVAAARRHVVSYGVTTEFCADRRNDLNVTVFCTNVPAITNNNIIAHWISCCAGNVRLLGSIIIRRASFRKRRVCTLNCRLTNYFIFMQNLRLPPRSSAW